MTKGLLGPIQNLHFTSVLGVRHVRSDEKVARRAQKFAFKQLFWHPRVGFDSMVGQEGEQSKLLGHHVMKGMEG